MVELEVQDLVYADHIAFFCKDKPSIEQTVGTVEQFGIVSGTQMHYSKIHAQTPLGVF